jgi:predicted acylesterase/phospholipase RssA
LKQLVDALRDEGRSGLAGATLTAVARRALRDEWRPDERAKLAEILRDHQQFGYGRRLLARVRRDGPDSEHLRQQHALCTYKDLELPTVRRLDRALEILGDLDGNRDAETLGLAGAVHKRRWEVMARRDDLEDSLRYYRRGFEQKGHPRWSYAGINAAFVADLLAKERDGDAALTAEASQIRTTILEELREGDEWTAATRGEALFGLTRFAEARAELAEAAKTKKLWVHETTTTQLGALAGLVGAKEDADARDALLALARGNEGAIPRARLGKVGVALSGGGYRASLFHIGVLARLAECRVLRHVEVLSCVSGGSIIGAFYYLKLRQMLEETDDAQITDDDYVSLVHEVATEFMDGVRKNLRGRLFTNPLVSARMALPGHTRSDRVAQLLDDHFYRRLRDGEGDWRMPELFVKPKPQGANFTLRYENWLRSAKIPILVLNATTLNTGHSWQFTAAWMGEPPSDSDERVDASRRLRRVYYADAPDRDELRSPRLAVAVGASACVPGLFAPVTLKRLYDDIDVELVDGGVHDNQGIASLLEQDCSVILVSDASGQLDDTDDPKRWAPKVLFRTNSISMKRIRAAQYDELRGRRRSGALRGFMSVHLTKGLWAAPRDWSDCQEPWTPEDDAIPAGAAPDYGIDDEAQRALAGLRTDLDAFSDDEAYGLMATGYVMTRRDLRDALPALAQAPPELERRDGWPFWAVLGELTSPAPKRLRRGLRFGDKLLFRGTRARAQDAVSGVKRVVTAPWRAVRSRLRR